MTPQKFRKKPIVIEAVQFTGDNKFEIAEFFKGGGKFNMFFDELLGVIRIETLEGVMTASVGDYVIKGPFGEFYPCKPAIFAATYDKAD